MTRLKLSLSMIAAASMALLAMTAASAHAKQIKFSGMHPIPKAVGGEFCYIEAPHVHVYEPENAKVLYRVHDDYNHFVGDPVAFGYDGPKHSYYGHHPVVIDPSIHVDVDVNVEPVTEFCYLDGPHFHHHAPPAGITFELKGGAYWYIGKYPPHYHKHRKVYEPIDVVYQPIEYVRPEVVVEAPAGYIGPIVDVHVDAPAVEVVAPVVEVEGHGHGHGHVHGGVSAGIDVHIPVPTIEIGIGVGGGVHHHGHVGHGKHKKFRRHGHRKHR
jgi:hypothetical protein